MKNGLMAYGFMQLKAGDTDYTPVFLIQDYSGKTNYSKNTKFLTHFVAQHPRDPKRLLLVPRGEMLGAIAGIVDRSTIDLKYFMASSGDHLLYGHGFFFGEGKEFVVTERGKDFSGRLVFRDNESLEVSRVIELPGFGPHDCVLLPDGNTVAVAMTGLNSAEERIHSGRVLLMNLRDGSVTGTMEAPVEAGIVHLSVYEHQLIGLLSGKNANGPAAFFTMAKFNEPFSVPSGPSDFKWPGLENFSVAVDTKRARALVTNPTGNVISYWDLKTRKLLKVVDVPGPVGVILADDGSTYIIIGTLGFIFHFDAETCELRKMVSSDIAGYPQFHLTNLEGISHE
ncbi:MAG: DUF1513 domain-containing protein [Bacteriovoracaceae bacterium]